MTAFPKPQPRPKRKPQGLKRTRWVRQPKVKKRRPDPQIAKPAHPKPEHDGKTAHGRRVRDWGRMAFCRAMGCLVAQAFAEEFGYVAGATWVDGHPKLVSVVPGPCDGRIEAMHLRERPQQHRPPDRRTAGGCEHHHREIDGKEGGRGPWFVRLTWEERRRLFDRLVAIVDAAWFAISDEERADWQARGQPQRRMLAA